MARWFKIQWQSKDTKQLSLTPLTKSQHNNNSIMLESPPSPTVPTATPPSSVARNPVVHHVSDADPMAGLTEAEKANARKKIAKLLRKERSIKIIVEANKTLLIGQGDAVIIKTSPERKPAIRKEDNMRSPVNLGEYVKVSGDSSPGNNRPEGFGFISKVAGVGAASMVTVKLDEIHGGSTHHGITMNDITPAIFGQEFAVPRPDRKQKCEAVTLTLSPETSRPRRVDRRSPIERLIDSLEAGARCPNMKKGWRPAKLSLNYGKKMKRGKLVMNHSKRQQLLVKVIMLEQHLANVRG